MNYNNCKTCTRYNQDNPDIKCFGCNGIKFYTESKKYNKKSWQKAENKTKQQLQRIIPEIKITPGSGNKDTPGDLQGKDIYVEVKSTIKKSYILNKDTLQGIRDESAAKDFWLLNLKFMNKDKVDFDLAVISMETYLFLLEEYYRSKK